MTGLLLEWLLAFLFGQAIEVPIYTRALARRRLPQAVLLGFVASLLTHPFVWFAFPRLVPSPYWLMALSAETFAVGAEALYLRALGVPAPLRWSLLANAASCGAGLLSSTFLGWP